MSDEDLAAEIRRCIEAAQDTLRLVQPPAEPPSAETVTNESTQDTPTARAEAFGFLDGRRMPLDELEAELKRRLDHHREALSTPDREAEGESPPKQAAAAQSAAETAYVPVVMPADQVIQRSSQDRHERKIRTAPAEPPRRKGLYFILAVVAVAAVSAPGSWNAISRHQEASQPIVTHRPDPIPQPARTEAPAAAIAEDAATAKAATEKAAAEMAIAEKAAAERAAIEKAAADKAAAEKAAAEKALQERAAAARAAEAAAAAVRAAEPKVLALPPSAPVSSAGNLPKSTPSSTAPWLQPKPFVPKP